ncbi:MAG: hypothetical protein RL322_2229 [Pseudomonadota bacterium]
MRSSALWASPLVVYALTLGTASAETFRSDSGTLWEASGFMKFEATRAGTAARRVPEAESTYQFDVRNAFRTPPASPIVQSRSSSLALQQLSLGVSHETDSAITWEARASYRWRSEAALNQLFRSPDVDYRAGGGWSGTDWFERLVGVSRPDLGSLRYGTQLSRAWARSDSFSYPVGLSNQWSGSGAAYGILPEALRLTSRTFEDGRGKLTAELTVGRDRLNTANVEQNRLTSTQQPFSPGPTEPELVELFLQYSVPGHLVEFVMQTSRGARQSAFGKGALIGWIGDPDTLGPTGAEPRRAGRPSQAVAILQGNHWPNPQNMLTYGLRYSQWSGSAASCNYDAVNGYCLFGMDPGFNYGDAPTHYAGFRGSSVDAMLGWSHYRGLYTYTAGFVWFGKASSDNPIEWGQSNSAISTNLGVHRKLPAVHKGASLYGGLGWSRFARIGPAPLSMPDNLFLGVNPLYDRSGAAVTLGFNIVF